MKTYTFLALGDSYTIGEQVPIFESFPYQTVQLLRKFFNTPTALPAWRSQAGVVNPVGGYENKSTVANPISGYQIAAPEIIAKTGWTTDELSSAIEQTVFSPSYDFVSLLIGVNNQYRGRAVDEFEKEFEDLLKQAIHFAGGAAKNVYVISIPDWGVTPFAKDRDTIKIATEIDTYNKVCERMATAYKTNFISITESQRLDAINPEFLASDGLHPSEKEYEKWAVKLSEMISAELK